MPAYTQAERPLSVTTPLGKDVLLVTGLRGHEAISQLFNFHIDLMAELTTEVHFDQILGQNVTLEMRLLDGSMRYFNGVVKRFSQGGRDENFVKYSAEVVPKLWFLTRNVRSRIFQHLTIPAILQQVLAGLDVVYEMSGTYYERDYCVQYRESDFAFASRLMEEEGIYYFFKHSDGSHQLVVTDIPSKHPTVPGPATAIYEEVAGEVREDMRVTTWEKSQELRSGECTLWDQCFELPGNPLEAKETTIDSVAVGKVVHKLKVGGNDSLELYDYPGGYAQRFDGINRAGGPRPSDILHIFEDRARTIRIRMEQEESCGLEIAGKSDCGHFTSGHEFTLDRHFDANAKYLLTRVEHDATQGDYHSAQGEQFTYHNRFTCIPSALRYRPARLTPKPAITGVQTALVVGPPGEEIFVDKYGRIKVQFPWDREGKKDINSSCWLRVAQVWAGNRWGAFFWPRIGHEVVVAFEDGDPDRPIVVGSVYNAANMPPLGLPLAKEFGGIKSESVRGSAGENYNSVVFVDVKGQEHLAIHSERHMILYAEFDVAQRSGRHHRQWVPSTHVTSVGSLPGSGGSGGGGSGGTTPTPTKTPTPPSDIDSPKASGQVFSAPHPQAVLGLSSTTVFGSAFAASAPSSFQLSFGGISKLIVDPVGFWAAFDQSPSPIAAELLSSGAFGSAQLVLGTSANMVMGQVYELFIGPPKVQLHTNNWTGFMILAQVMGIIMFALSLVFLIAYGIQGSVSNTGKGDLHADDDVRADTVMAFQAVMQLCIFTLIMVHNSHVNKLEKLAIDTVVAVYYDNYQETTYKVQISERLLTDCVLISELLVAGIVPDLLEAHGETKLAGLDQKGSG
jgi:type VI secretion system secreted protein VgrG